MAATSIALVTTFGPCPLTARTQFAQQRQVAGERQVLSAPVDPCRLAQLPAAPHAQLEAQRPRGLVFSLQLLPKRLRRRPQLAAGAAEVHGDARIERVAELEEDDACLVTAQL